MNFPKTILNKPLKDQFKRISTVCCSCSFILIIAMLYIIFGMVTDFTEIKPVLYVSGLIMMGLMAYLLIMLAQYHYRKLRKHDLRFDDERITLKQGKQITHIEPNTITSVFKDEQSLTLQWVGNAKVESLVITEHEYPNVLQTFEAWYNQAKAVFK